jgi:hypothetical protein
MRTFFAKFCEVFLSQGLGPNILYFQLSKKTFYINLIFNTFKIGFRRRITIIYISFVM